jgi:hypothetical protein
VSEAGDSWIFDVRRPEVVPENFVQVDDSQAT